MRTRSTLALVASLVIATAALAAPPASQLLVVCAPGSPGTTEEAQPRMDTFAAALSARAKMPIQAVYEPSEAGGVKRIAGASLAIVSLPFFLEHEKALGLKPRLVAVQQGRPALESWTLVAQKGRIKAPAQLAGFTIVSTAGFAPGFVRGAVQEGFGALPENVKIAQSSAVVSALRRAANGDQVAVLLDGGQAQALGALPFASKLEVVARSPAWPAGLVVTVDAKLPAKAWPALESAFLGLGKDPAGANALAALQIEKFVPLDNRALASARRTVSTKP